jgi:hypothetical protein
VLAAGHHRVTDDTDDLVALIASLLANREPPDHVRAHTEARRLAVAEVARAAVAQTLAQRPNYPEVARLGMRLLSRYFDGADTAIFLMHQEQPSIFASSGWSVRTQPPGILGYALDVVVSGSTLIVPDLAAMPGRAPHAAVEDWRLFAAVPLRTTDGLAIGALALADRRVMPFDVHDLGILLHIAKRLEAVFSGFEGPGVLEGAGVLVGIGLLGARGLCPTDGGAALLDVVHWLLDSAMARGPATILHARLAPAAIDHRAAA